MDQTIVFELLNQLNLKPEAIVSIYNYGSWVYGTNTPTSDRDLLIVTRNYQQKPLQFSDNLEYYHEFELHKVDNRYDICIHSVENFELLLEKHYLLAVECLFLPDEFKIKEEIDFKQIFLEKYFDKTRLAMVACYENQTSLNEYLQCRPSSAYASSGWSQDDIDYKKNSLFKNMFHGFRYLDFAEQLIRTRSIYDFTRATPFFQKMKELYEKATIGETENDFVEFWNEKSKILKATLQELSQTNVIQGTFEAHVTVDCSNNTEETIQHLKKVCENTKYKIIFIELNSSSDEPLKQLMTSSYYCGEYPSIVKVIEDEVRQKFCDFKILRVKIESLASNKGVPQTKLHYELFWDSKTNYFEFHYKILVKKNNQENQYEILQLLCKNSGSNRLHLSHNAFKVMNNDEFHYMITARIFGQGRNEAFEKSDRSIDYLRYHGFPPLKVVREFVVYDTCLELDNAWA